MAAGVVETETVTAGAGAGAGAAVAGLAIAASTSSLRIWPRLPEPLISASLTLFSAISLAALGAGGTAAGTAAALRSTL